MTAIRAALRRLRLAWHRSNWCGPEREPAWHGDTWTCPTCGNEFHAWPRGTSDRGWRWHSPDCCLICRCL